MYFAWATLPSDQLLYLVISAQLAQLHVTAVTIHDSDI